MKASWLLHLYRLLIRDAEDPHGRDKNAAVLQTFFWVIGSSPKRGSINQGVLSGRRLTTEQREDFARDVARVCLGSEKDKRRSDFLRLSGPLHRGLRTVMDCLLGTGAGNEGSPNGAWRDAVDPDLALD